MNIQATDLHHDARERAYALPLAEINVADPELFRTDTMWPYFERLRKEAPVHYQSEHEFGPYWSVTKYNDIMAIDTNHADFSSEPSITIADPKEDFTLPMFIAMDPPKARCAAQGGEPGGVAGQSRISRPHHPRARGRDSGFAAYRRRFRLGGQGLHRTDDDDARHPVRFSVGRPPQAHLLVRYRDRGQAISAFRVRRTPPRTAL